jgi:hypothetical protein
MLVLLGCLAVATPSLSFNDTVVGALVGAAVVVTAGGAGFVVSQVPVTVKSSWAPTTVMPLLQKRRLFSHELSVRSEARAHAVGHLAASTGSKVPGMFWKHVLPTIDDAGAVTSSNTATWPLLESLPRSRTQPVAE